MQFTRDESHRERARAFAREELAPSVAARDDERRWDPALFRRLGESGLLGSVLPSAFGGADLPVRAFAGVLRGIGEGSGDAGLAFAWTAHLLGCALPIARLGTDPQRTRFLGGLARGELVGAFAHAEQAPTQHPTAVSTTAKRGAKGRWTLHGTKAFVTNAPIADLFVVTALTDPDAGKHGVSAFLVTRDTPGVRVGRTQPLAGLRTATVSELVLDGCEVGEEDLVAGVGQGITEVDRLVRRWDRALRFAAWTGLLRALLDESTAEAREGLRFGRAVAHSQLVRAALADLRIRVELSDRTLEHAAAQLDAGGPHVDRDLASAALFLSGSLAFVGRALEAQGPRAIEAGRLGERLSRDAATLLQLGEPPAVLRAVLGGALVGLG